MGNKCLLDFPEMIYKIFDSYSNILYIYSLLYVEAISHKLLNTSMKTYAKIATIGTHMMHIPIRNIAKHLHHNGHSLAMVTPCSASHASYVDPDMTICTNDATSIPVIATGEINFQHINQYKFGREPVISSMSFENLDR